MEALIPLQKTKQLFLNIARFPCIVTSHITKTLLHCQRPSHPSLTSRGWEEKKTHPVASSRETKSTCTPTCPACSTPAQNGAKSAWGVTGVLPAAGAQPRTGRGHHPDGLRCSGASFGWVAIGLAAPTSAANTVRVTGTQLGTAAPWGRARFQKREEGKAERGRRELLLLPAPAHQLPFSRPDPLAPARAMGTRHRAQTQAHWPSSLRRAGWRRAVCRGTLRSTSPVILWVCCKKLK